jgi:hypothetical protein
MARRTNDDFNNLNKDDREAGTGLIVSYQSEEGGITLAVPGDDDAPYVIANGRASDDGVAGLVAEPNGEMQRIAVNEWGHLWVNVANPIPTPPTPPITKHVNAFSTLGEDTPVIGAGTLYRVTAAIYAGTGFLQLWDGAPGVGAPLYTPIPIPTTLPAYIDIEFDTINGLAFGATVTVAISTTAPNYTAPAAFPASPGTVTTSFTV